MASSVCLPAFLFVVWLLWIPLAVWEKHAKGDGGGTSILPVFPLFPLAAWGLAALLDRLHEELGLMLVGGAHVVLLLSFLVSAYNSYRLVRRRRAGPTP